MILEQSIWMIFKYIFHPHKYVMSSHVYSNIIRCIIFKIKIKISKWIKYKKILKPKINKNAWDLYFDMWILKCDIPIPTIKKINFFWKHDNSRHKTLVRQAFDSFSRHLGHWKNIKFLWLFHNCKMNIWVPKFQKFVHLYYEMIAM
jgi:hypothetical protein